MFKPLVIFLTIVFSFHGALAGILQREYETFIESNEISENGNAFKEPELYWRPYVDQEIPEDAVLAGTRRKFGKDIGVYIGQADIDVEGAQVQSVAIYSDTSYVTSTYKRTVTTNKNVRILCSNATNIDHIIAWIPSEQADKFDPDEDFVITGHELSMVTWSNTNLYTGRGTYNDDFVVGKIVMGSQSFRFYPVYDHHEVLQKSNYEILVYAKALSKLKES